MKRTDFDKQVESILKDLRETLLRKGTDYADPEDAFKNFRQIATLTSGRVSMETGIFTRITDKVSRIGNLLDSPNAAAVKDERLEDSVQDLIGYATLLLTALRAKGRPKVDGFCDGGALRGATLLVTPEPKRCPRLACQFPYGHPSACSDYIHNSVVDALNEKETF